MDRGEEGGGREALEVNFVSVTEYCLLIDRIVKHDFMEGKVESLGVVFLFAENNKLRVIRRSAPSVKLVLKRLCKCFVRSLLVRRSQ